MSSSDFLSCSYGYSEPRPYQQRRVINRIPKFANVPAPRIITSNEDVCPFCNRSDKPDAVKEPIVGDECVAKPLRKFKTDKASLMDDVRTRWEGGEDK